MPDEAAKPAVAAAAAHQAGTLGGGDPTGPETDIWSGNPSWKGFIFQFFLMVVWLAIVGTLVALVPFFKEGAAGVFTASLLGIGGAGYLLVTILIGRYSRGYRLTNQRFHISKGFLSRVYDQTDLRRIDDVSYSQSLLQRIFGIGTVTVTSPTDRSDPRVEMDNIDEPAKVTELINKYRLEARKKTTVMVDNV